MRKAGREAGEFTNWVAPNLQYEEAVETFVRAILGDSRFTADLETFVAEILEPGQINSLAQTLLKLAAPGIPDIYQGTEIWNLGLVDPDNRRLVDYDLRRQMLRSMFDDSPPETILARMDIGLPKLWVIRQGLALRRKHPDWFDAGSAYTPLQIEHPHREAMPERQAEETVIISEEAEKEGLLVAVTGSPKVGREDPAVAFLRGTNVLVAVPRLIVHFGAVWDRYHLTVPSGEWRNWLTHEVIAGGKISLAELFSRFPAALLAREA
jgi:(1->4)-alpha-D-glucan 1-alpha-D-glucosylmutase